MSKDKKAKVDINSVHSKLADKYKIKRDINTKTTSSIKDFKSVSDTIKKLEKIIDKGKDLAEKDKDYNEYLKSIRKSIEEQKYQLFQLKLSNGESNIINLLLNINDNSTANDFVAIEREINKYHDLIMSLEPESKISESYNILWCDHYSTIENHFDELQKKKIRCSVVASKRRVKAAKKEFEKKLIKATKTLIGSDVTITKRSYAKLKLIIEEAALTGQKDEIYSQYLDKQKTKLMKYEEEIDEVRLKIDISKHRQLIEQAQPSVKESLDQLKKESGISTDESVEIEGSEHESVYSHINEKTPFEENEKSSKNEKSDNKETIVEKDSGDKVQNFDYQTISSKTSSSIWRTGVSVIIQTSIIISLIYFSSNNYILSRDLNHLLPIQEKKLSLIKSNIVGEQLVKTKAFDEHYSKKSVLITKLLSSLVPDATSISRLTLNQKEESGNFVVSLYGKIGVAGSSGRRILNQMISDIKKQNLIKDAVLINQQTIKQSSIIFTIDIII